MAQKTGDKILDNIRAVKQNLGEDWDYSEEGYGELKNMTFTALDIADELREAVLGARARGDKIVLGQEVPVYYKNTIITQLMRIKAELGGGQ